MSPLDELATELTQRFPDSRSDVRKADDPEGFQILNFRTEGLEVAVEWKREEGFGISAFCDDANDLDGLFDAPDEWYSNREAVFHRIVSLALDHKSTKPLAITLPEMRHERGVSQETMAERLKVKQATFSKLERREDVRVSSLRRVVEAMGGKLLIQAIFTDTRDVREIRFR
jgi:DNA-binding XRE family transcriptional regulator